MPSLVRTRPGNAAVPHRLANTSRAAIVLYWPLGMALVSWRYLWQTTPLHRTEESGDSGDLPPEPPAELVDERSQLAESGSGPLFHRRFIVDIHGGHVDPPRLLNTLTADLNQAVPSEVTAVHDLGRTRPGLQPGDEFVVRMPGPWDGPVRVIHRDDTALRLMTLAGHLEAGQIEFRAERTGACLRFVIEAWARPSNSLVRLLYARLRLAKEIQCNMWVRFCRSTASLAGGRARGGITIHTRKVPHTPEGV
ncbi:DUF1990 family protein [Haloactinomyces albus]|uniref:DUF1990 domain-containing protein n=1 Tax=Haloactinomyces albus TaxID=1352928 RepID=A0AAE4CJN9_9ACTN|nr:DUF1990 family protein [Haloactinomyces albus]MDR7300250.1 hypothetical protein [Haloactinomyces albus]